jgi:hypothetical protein
MTTNEAMSEIRDVMDTFVHKLGAAIDAEVRRQMVTKLDEAIKQGDVSVRDAKKTGPKEGSKAQAKPCPVTGVLNTHRRFSYLMPEARTPENLAKYKRGK